MRDFINDIDNVVSWYDSVMKSKQFRIEFVVSQLKQGKHTMGYSKGDFLGDMDDLKKRCKELQSLIDGLVGYCEKVGQLESIQGANE